MHIVMVRNIINCNTVFVNLNSKYHNNSFNNDIAVYLVGHIIINQNQGACAAITTNTTLKSDRPSAIPAIGTMTYLLYLSLISPQIKILASRLFRV